MEEDLDRVTVKLEKLYSSLDSMTLKEQIKFYLYILDKLVILEKELKNLLQ